MSNKKVQLKDILKEGEKLKGVKLDASDPKIIALINSTIAQQTAIMKCKGYDPKTGAMIIEY